MKGEPLICFRCGQPITGDLYVETLSKEIAHIYCQATGVKPIPHSPDKEQGK